MRPDSQIDHLLTQDHLVLRREHPDLHDALTRGCSQGRLVRVLPGVYADRSRADDPAVRMAAICRWDPDAVVQSHGAAKLTFWPKIALPSTLNVASTTQHRPQPGFAFTRRRIPAELVMRAGPVRLTTPALTALELATPQFTEPIDVALHSRQVTLDSLYDALRATPQRAGNVDRRQVLLDSRAEPWSQAERLAHRVFRVHGIAGWVANRKVVVSGSTYFLDVGFDRERIAAEIDGRTYHCQPDVFESDRARQNALVLDGWLIVRFTWLMLTREPDYVVRIVREALGARRDR